MKKSLLIALVLAISAPAFAQNASCAATAADKKLAGAAKTSFLKKCEQDAAATCDMQATEKKLAGAAKKSFLHQVREGCRRRLIRPTAPARRADAALFFAGQGVSGSPM